MRRQGSRRRIARPMAIMLISVGVLFVGIFGFKAFINGKIHEALAAYGNAAQIVSATTATLQDWQPDLEAVGSLRAVNGADLSTQVGGIVSAIHFESGTDVARGALLVELLADDDIAKLDSLKAQAALAQVTWERDVRQFKVKGVSQQTVDADQENLKSALAQVTQQQATLDYKRIRAPFAGRLGIRQVDLGQYLSPGTTIVSLQSLDPIYVDFFLPQQALDKIAVGQKVAMTVDAYPGQDFAGEISAIGAKVDPSSRNLSIRATISNPDRKLLPGMFATVKIEVGTAQRYVTLPRTAIAYNSYGSTVYLVEHENGSASGLIARQTFVSTGETKGDKVAILNGIKPGDTVVTSGQIKLHNGSPIAINNSVTPTASEAPLPADR